MSTETQRAEMFAKEHLLQCAKELIQMQDTAVLADGKVRELAVLCAAYAGRVYALPVAESLVKRAALELAAQASQAAELAALKADIARQATEIEALRKDAERLGALEAANFNSAMWLVARGKDSFTVAMKSPYGNCVTRRTLREAIDAAMQTKEAS